MKKEIFTNNINNGVENGLGNVFPNKMNDFTRIYLEEDLLNKVNEIDALRGVSSEDIEYDNVFDVVLYCNDKCNYACGIVIEIIKSKYVISIIGFDELVNTGEGAAAPYDFKSVEELLVSEWGYAGTHSIVNGEEDSLAVSEDNLLRAKELLFKYIGDKSLI